MKKFFAKLILTGVFLPLFGGAIAAQKKAETPAPPETKAESLTKNCKTLVLGKIVSNPMPEYPADAKNAAIGGTVEVNVKIDEKGNVVETEKVVGNPILQGAAVKSALSAKFSPTFCDGAAAQISGVVIYNFIPNFYTETYFSPAKIEELTDVPKDSPYYETLIDLLENDKIAFGFADRKFHSDAPLTRGDFAQFLRLTLEMLSERARIAGKLPRDINLFAPHNPGGITSADKILDLNAKQPYAESVKMLLLKYDVLLTTDDGKFHGYQPLTQAELIEFWTAIFGADVFPVNF